MEQYLTLQNIGIATGFALILIGLYGGLTNKNILRIIVSFTIFNSGLNIVIVALAYLKGRVAPIIDDTTGLDNLSQKFVDPVPQALVLTAIVIGLGVTGVMLAYALKMYQNKQTLNINDFKETKW
ncbi:MAG: cation:proton antiporter [Marinilabiliales bacterium]|nr:MAG: cation:proton antiporter [Marinilabiliales bacterium]